MSVPPQCINLRHLFGNWHQDHRLFQFEITISGTPFLCSKLTLIFIFISLLSSFSPQRLPIEFYVTHWVLIYIIDASFFVPLSCGRQKSSIMVLLALSLSHANQATLLQQKLQRMLVRYYLMIPTWGFHCGLLLKVLEKEFLAYGRLQILSRLSPF